MQSDRYLRAVLTVIAVCLVWICLRDVVIVEPAHAYGPQDVNVVNWPGVQNVNLLSEPIGVNVKNWPLSFP